MMKYKKLFLDEIKLLLLYLVEFSKNRSILLKKYPNDYIVGSANQISIIMIIYNKSIFSTNNSCQKV